MDVQTCIDKYYELSAVAFTRKRYKKNLLGRVKDEWYVDGKYGAENLEKEMKAFVQEKLGDAEAELTDRDGKCKV